MLYKGACKCGKVNYSFTSNKTKKELVPRSDRHVCSFCDKHDGVWVSNPEGVLEVDSDNKIEVMKFGEQTVEFCICKDCSDLCYALYKDEEGNSFGAVTAQTLEGFRVFVGEVMKTDYRNESTLQAQSRRKKNWTPVKFV